MGYGKAMRKAAAAAEASALRIQQAQEASAERERVRRMGETAPMREYEAARMARGKMALEGRYNVTQDPQFRMQRAALQKMQGTQLSDIEEAGAKGGLGGFSASYLSEKMKETGANTILNLATSMQGRQQELVEEGSAAGQNIARILQPEFAGEMAQRGAYTQGMYGQSLGEQQLRSQAEIAKKQQQTSAFSSGMSACCFIFYAGNKFIRAIHMYRDEFYPNEGFVGLGYRLMAFWLVPIMGRNKFVKKLVITIMLDPLAKYAVAYYSGQTWKKLILTPFKLFWPNVWAMYGRTALAYEKVALRLGV